MDIIVKLKPDDIKEVIDKYLYTSEDLRVKTITFRIGGGQMETTGSKNTTFEPYYLKEIICTCEKIKNDIC
jgi:hypothetical protein